MNKRKCALKTACVVHWQWNKLSVNNFPPFSVGCKKWQEKKTTNSKRTKVGKLVFQLEFILLWFYDFSSEQIGKQESHWNVHETSIIMAFTIAIQAAPKRSFTDVFQNDAHTKYIQTYAQPFSMLVHFNNLFVRWASVAITAAAATTPIPFSLIAFHYFFWQLCLIVVAFSIPKQNFLLLFFSNLIINVHLFVVFVCIQLLLGFDFCCFACAHAPTHNLYSAKMIAVVRNHFWLS